MAHIQSPEVIKKVLAEQKLPACSCGQPLSLNIVVDDHDGHQVRIGHGFMGEAFLVMPLHEATEKILLLSIRDKAQQVARQNDLAEWLDSVHRHQGVGV